MNQSQNQQEQSPTKIRRQYFPQSQSPMQSTYTQPQAIMTQQSMSQSQTYSPYNLQKVQPVTQYMRQSSPLRTVNQHIEYQPDQEIPVQLQEPQNYSSNNKTMQNLCIILMPLILALIFFFTALWILVYETDPKVELNNSDQVLKFVFHNLDQNPIYSIAQMEASCPNGEFGGINLGCICENGQVTEFKECSSGQTTCRSVDELDSIDLMNWEGRNFCVKTEHNWQRKYVCEQGFTKCASDLCVPTDERLCPDNKISTLVDKNGQPTVLQRSFQSLMSPEQQQSQSTSEFQLVELGVGQYVQFRFDDTELQTRRPFNNFVVSTQEQVCYEDNKLPMTQSKKFYPLLKDKAVGCGTYGALSEDYFKVLAVQSLQNLYTSNRIQNDLSAYPYWSQYLPSSDPAYLIAIKKIEVLRGNNLQTCESVDRTNFQYAAESALWGRANMHRIALAILISSCLVFVMLLVLVVFLLGNFKNETKIVVTKIYIVSSFVLVLVAFVALFFFFAFINGRLDSASNKLESYRVSGCFKDAGVNLAIQHFSNYHKHSLQLYSPGVWTWFIGSLLYTFIWLFLIYQMKRKEYIEQRQDVYR